MCSLLAVSSPPNACFRLQKTVQPFPLHMFQKREIPPKCPCSPASETPGKRRGQHQPHIFSYHPSASKTAAPMAPTVTPSQWDHWPCLMHVQHCKPHQRQEVFMQSRLWHNSVNVMAKACMDCLGPQSDLTLQIQKEFTLVSQFFPVWMQSVRLCLRLLHDFTLSSIFSILTKFPLEHTIKCLPEVQTNEIDCISLVWKTSHCHGKKLLIWSDLTLVNSYWPFHFIFHLLLSLAHR